MRTAPDADRERPLILVIEDDKHDREIYGRILCYNGFDVIFAARGREGLGLAREFLPDALLLDLGLPDVHGLEVCTALRAEAATRGMPIIALSAFAESHMGNSSRLAGCTRYIEKPASPTSVLHAIEEIVGKPPLPGIGRPPTMLETMY